jgi:hypothetical protein
MTMVEGGGEWRHAYSCVCVRLLYSTVFFRVDGEASG